MEIKFSLPSLQQISSEPVKAKEQIPELKINDTKPELDKEFTKKQLEATVDSLNGFISPSLTNLKFTLHDKLNEYYVQVVDSTTNEVIREIPSKKMMDLFAAMKEYLGVIIDKKI